MADISAVLNLHAEGILAHISLLSMLDAKSVAETCGIGVEILIVADCPDAATVRYLETAQRLGARVLQTEVDDLGLARNVAVAACESRFIAFLDGDDLWADSWLSAAYAAATQDARPIVWHPEVNLYFGTGMAAHWRTHPDMDDHIADWTRLGLINLWTSLAFASRETFVRVPYSTTDLKASFGYEDWYWNSETIARGIVHKIVPGTAHLIRMNQSSLLRRTGAARSLPRPSSLFRKQLSVSGQSFANGEPGL